VIVTATSVGRRARDEMIAVLDQLIEGVTA
jgi:hypothetical protein